MYTFPVIHSNPPHRPPFSPPPPPTDPDTDISNVIRLPGLSTSFFLMTSLV